MFRLEENNTTVRTEVIAGITTFMTMAYILAVNPNMLAAAGMDATAVLIATCLASFVGTICMALLANYPFALAPGMGLNAYFAYTVCGNMGYDWRVALAAVAVGPDFYCTVTDKCPRSDFQCHSGHAEKRRQCRNRPVYCIYRPAEWAYCRKQ